MATDSTNSNTTSGTQAIASGVLENLASRFRGSGLCLVQLNPDASLAYADNHAPTFFQRYAIPIIRYRVIEQMSGAANIPKFPSDGTVKVFEPFPGVIMAAFSSVDRKQEYGTIGLLGKSALFHIGTDTQRLCQELGLDAEWLAQQANNVPSFVSDQLQRESRLLSTMVRDQLRITGMQQEVDSLSNQLANTYEELSLIYQVSSRMKVNRSASDFFKQACLDLIEVTDVRGMGVVLRAENLQHREPVVYGSISFPPGYVHRIADTLITKLKQKPEALLINNLKANPELSFLSEFAERMLAVPLQRGDQVMGCLFAFDKTEGDFDTVDSKLLTSIANESSIYLENASLFEDVRGLMMGLLHSLTSAVDAKDAYTCGHSERVALMSKELSRSAGVSEQLSERIYMAGLLHDVGKIGVPESVLQKPGKLTDEEFTLMKQHPDIGARILKDVKQLEDIIPGVLHHHERYDGRGYPAKLAGENIPLMGRIICLADCFDAMTSSRTYRKALPFEVAMMEIQKGSGTQFDPVLTEAFMRIGEKRLRELVANEEDQSRRILELNSTLRVA